MVANPRIAILIILVLGVATYRAQCHDNLCVIKLPISRSVVQKPQQEVNHGHQPRLLDPRAVADDAINNLDEKYKQGSYAVFSKLVSSQTNTAVYRHELPSKTES